MQSYYNNNNNNRFNLYSAFHVLKALGTWSYYVIRPQLVVLNEHATLKDGAIYERDANYSNTRSSGVQSPPNQCFRKEYWRNKKKLFMSFIFHFFEYAKFTDHSIFSQQKWSVVSGEFLGCLPRNSPEWNLCGCNFPCSDFVIVTKAYQ